MDAQGIYLLSKKFLVTPENIFQNILITNPLWHEVNNETSFHNSAQIHVCHVSVSDCIFICMCFTKPLHIVQPFIMFVYESF